jgi:hypothetical protein
LQRPFAGSEPRPCRNPAHRFLGQFVEGNNCQSEVLFLRVLELVVADAEQTLDKHHDGEDAGAPALVQVNFLPFGRAGSYDGVDELPR